MGVEKLAAWTALVGMVLVAVGVGFFDWRAGIIVFGVLCVAAGIWTLKE